MLAITTAIATGLRVSGIGSFFRLHGLGVRIGVRVLALESGFQGLGSMS